MPRGSHTYARSPRTPKPKPRAGLGVPRVALKLRQLVHDAHGAPPATIRKSTAGHRAEDTFNAIRTLNLHGFGISEEHLCRKIGPRRDTLQRKLCQILAPNSSVRERLKTDDSRLLEMLDTIYAELNDAAGAASKKGTEHRRAYSDSWKKIMSSDDGVLTDARIKLLETATRDAGMWEGVHGPGAAAQQRQGPMAALAAAGEVAEAVQAADDAAQVKILELQQALETEKQKVAKLQARNDRLERALERAQAGGSSSASRVVYGGSLVIAPQ